MRFSPSSVRRAFSTLAPRTRTGRISSLLLMLLGVGGATGASLRPGAHHGLSAAHARTGRMVELVGNWEVRVPGQSSGPPAWVRVEDADGIGMPGVAVTFESIGDASGHVAASTVITDYAGQAGTYWTLPTKGPFKLRICTATAPCVTYGAYVTRSMVIVAGNNQVAAPGQPVGPVNPAVKLLDQLGRPVDGDTLYWYPNSNGRVTPGFSASDANGVASIPWTMPTAAPYTLGFCVHGVCQTESITAIPGTPAGPPSTMAKISSTLTECGQGGHPCMTLGTAGPNNPAVIVKDNTGATLNGVKVNFSLAAGGGTLGGAGTTVLSQQVLTGQSDPGQAAIAWTFPADTGTYVLTARVDPGEVNAANIPPVTFTSHVTPHIVTVVQGGLGDAPWGSQVLPDAYFKVADVNGAIVTGLPVTWQATGDARLVNARTTTDVSGQAFTSWFLGTTGNDLKGCVAGTTECVSFHARVTGLVHSFEQISTTSPDCTGTGHPCMVLRNAGKGDPTVYLLDEARQPVSGKTVTWAMTGGTTNAGAVVSGSQGTPGQAAVSWTFPKDPGSYSLVATLDPSVPTTHPLSPVTFNASVTALSIEIAQGDGGTGAPDSLVGPMNPTVRVKDAAGGVVSGVAIAWDLGGNGSLVSAQTVTDANGQAGASWRLGQKGFVLKGCLAAPLSGCVTFRPSGVSRVPTTLAWASSTDASCGRACLPLRTSGAGNPTVIARDYLGRPVNGVKVNFARTGGTLSAASALTGSQSDSGQVAVVWTFPDSAGLQSLTATIDTSSATVGTIAPLVLSQNVTPYLVTVEAGDGGSAPSGGYVVPDPYVRVSDNTGARVAGAPIAWTPKGGGSVDATTGSTNASGIAGASWKLFNAPDSLSACVSGTKFCRWFTATRTTDAAVAMLLAEPSAYQNCIGGTSAASGCLVTRTAGLGNPAVHYIDAAHHSIVGDTIDFRAARGSASPAFTLTGSDGIASSVWRFDSLPGWDTLTISVRNHPEVAAVRYLADVRRPTLTILAGNDLAGVAGSPSGPPNPGIRATDGAGRPVVGAPFTFVSRDGGSTAPGSGVTDGDGQASTLWGLSGAAAATDSMQACVLGSCTWFTARVPRPRLVMASGIASYCAAGTTTYSCNVRGNTAASGQNPGVKLLNADGTGMLVAGKTVVWKVGSTVVAQTATDAGGQASVQWTYPDSGGTYALSATVPAEPGLGTVSFVANVAPAVVTRVAGNGVVPDANGNVAASVRVSDAGQNPLAGMTVAFAAGGGTVGTATTDTTGLASYGWHVVTGSPTLTACVPGGVCTTFTAGSAASTGILAVSVRDVNPGAAIARGECLTIAAGEAAAYECGDLRIVHPLPATTTMNKTRAPVLFLDSRHAAPVALIAAAVTARAGTSAVKLDATVSLAEHTITRTYDWTSAMSDGAARRIVVPADVGSWPLPTGAYPYTMHVSLRDGAITVGDAADSGTVIIVNRSTSPFGAGWWLDGLEQLVSVSGHPEQMLWVGGDGSARIYARDSSAVWIAQQPLDGPDSLTKDTASGHWMRHLGNGAYTEFDGALRHVATVNRLGHRTAFGYVGAALSTITLPIPPGSGATAAQRTYTFTPTAVNGLTQSLAVAAPPLDGAARGVTLSYNDTPRRWTLAGPDTTYVTIGVDSLGRPVSRSDRRHVTTTYAYDSLGGGTLAQSRLDATTPTEVHIVRGFCASEAAGLPGEAGTFRCAPGPVALASVRSTYDGPRSNTTDSTDVTTFALNRFGAVTQVTDAYLRTTTLERTDPHWPSLVTKTTAPNGHVALATYDAASGHLLTSTDVGGIFADSAFTTTYVWNAKWDEVERVIPPGNDSTVIGIDLATGDRIWQQDARGSVSRVSFTYDPVTRLVATVTQPGATARDSIVYDGTLGNLAHTTTPGGAVTFHTRDAIGRDSVLTMPTVLASSPRVKQTITYDLMDRVKETKSEGPALGYTVQGGRQADSAAVQALALVTSNHYDNEGNLLDASALSENSTSDASTTSSSSYDAANRVTTRHTGGNAESFTYDAAGNVLSQQYPGGGTATTVYDRLNRPRTRIVSARDYPRQTCNGFPEGPLSPIGAVCNMMFPYYPNDATGTGLHVSGDTVTFAYDEAGNLQAADNRDARIRRTYTLGGQLTSDTTKVPMVAVSHIDSVSSIRYVVSGAHAFRYDRSGRRLAMDWAMGTTQYHYTGFGALESVTDPLDNTYHVAYDAEGRQDSLVVLPTGSSTAGVWDTFGYDVEGRLARRTRTSAAATIQVIRGDTLGYDLRGKLTSVETGGANQPQEHITFAYDGMGAVLAKDQMRGTGEFATEEFRNDAMGNVLYSVSRASAGTNDAPFVSAYEPSGGGRLLTRQTALPPVPAQRQSIDELLQRFAGSNLSTLNHLITTQPVDGQVARSQVAERHYYTGDDKLAVIQKYTSAVAGTWEEYRYDALGRRVMTRTLRNVPSSVDSRYALCSPPAPCDSYTERAVWDGDHLQYETRARESGSDNVQNSGSVGYVHLLELDKPVAVIRDGEVRVINYDWHGLGESSVHPDGSGADCVLDACTAQVDWPGGGQGGVYYTPSLISTQGSATSMWLGTLTANGGGTTGALYRRNRYYSTESGQFTQQDPIGLGGGVNLYGFASGDPVSYSDPFGLCKSASGEERECTVTWSDVDHPNKNVDPRVMAAAHELAELADVDLVLSSGLRTNSKNPNSSHRRGLALDISKIDGVDIGQPGYTAPGAMDKAEKVQNTLFTMQQVRENFGPAGLYKSTSRGNPQDFDDGSAKRAQLQKEHRDHVHFSIQP